MTDISQAREALAAAIPEYRWLQVPQPPRGAQGAIEGVLPDGKAAIVTLKTNEVFEIEFKNGDRVFASWIDERGPDEWIEIFRSHLRWLMGDTGRTSKQGSKAAERPKGRPGGR